MDKSLKVGSLVRYWKGVRKGYASGVGRITAVGSPELYGFRVYWIEGCSGFIAGSHVESVDDCENCVEQDMGNCPGCFAEYPHNGCGHGPLCDECAERTRVASKLAEICSAFADAFKADGKHGSDPIAKQTRAFEIAAKHGWDWENDQEWHQWRLKADDLDVLEGGLARAIRAARSHQ